MNKVIVTQPHLFMMVVGPSGSGKTRLVADVIIKQKELFYPRFDKKITCISIGKKYIQKTQKNSHQ